MFTHTANIISIVPFRRSPDVREKNKCCSYDFFSIIFLIKKKNVSWFPENIETAAFTLQSNNHCFVCTVSQTSHSSEITLN